MSGFDGNGNFVMPYNWSTDKANGIKIRADRMDGQDGAIATGLSTCVTRDGQSPPTANLPMGTFKHTGVGAASSRTDYLRADQLQDGGLTYFTTGGTIDAYTLTPSPAITAYAPGLSFFIRIHATSTSATPTLNISGVANTTISNADGSNLEPQALKLDGVYQVMYQGTVGFVLPGYNTPNILAIKGVAEKITVSATNATGTIQFDALTQGVLYYNTISSANWTFNVRGNSSLSLNNTLQTGDSFSVVHMVKNGTVGFYPSVLTIDGTTITPKWVNGTTITAGDANSVDSWRYTIIKTAASTYDVFAAVTKYA